VFDSGSALRSGAALTSTLLDSEKSDPRVAAILQGALELPDSFRGARGSVRLGLVRNATDWLALEGGSKPDWVSPGRDLLCSAYAAWVQNDEFLLLSSRRVGAVSAPLVVAVKARKRGNDVDVKRSKDRLAPVYDRLVEYVGGSTRYRFWNDTRCAGKTSLLFVTLTWDPAYSSRWDAWMTVGEEWNRFLAALLKEYGPVRVVRSWESFENGYPHIHADLAFEETWFNVWCDVQGNGSVKWRVDDEPNRFIHGAWRPAKVVDVQAIYGGDGEHEVRKSVNNTVWYVLKGADSDYSKMESWSYKGLLTRSLLWFFRKKSWSASRSLVGPPGRLDSSPCVIQTAEPIVWTFLGMVERSFTELGVFDWVKIYPTPPPWLDRGWCPGSSAKWSTVRGHGYRFRGTVETPASRLEALCRVLEERSTTRGTLEKRSTTRGTLEKWSLPSPTVA